MKEHVQDYGVRKWAGDDLIELQSEPLSALQALVAPYAPCIISGCEMETISDGNGDGSPAYRLHAGYVALKGSKTQESDKNPDGTEDGAGADTGNDAGVSATAENGENAESTTEPKEYVKIVRVKAQTVNQPTVFLALGCTPVSRAYGNGENKPIAYNYTAEVCDILAQVGDRPYLTLVADNRQNPRLPDTLGITQKLDRVGGEAKDTVVGFTAAASRAELTTGSKLGVLFGLVKKWLSDLRALAFKDKVAKADLTDELAGELDDKVVKENGKGLSANNFTDALKDKLTAFSHAAGGDLEGNFPNPTIKPDVHLTGSPTVEGHLTVRGVTDEGCANLILGESDEYGALTRGAVISCYDSGLEMAAIGADGSGRDVIFYHEPAENMRVRYDYRIPHLDDPSDSDRCLAALGTIREAGFAKENDKRFTDSRIPKGTAGGSLAGTYPNPTIANSVYLPGSPYAETPSTSDNGRRIATTAYVKNNLANYALNSHSHAWSEITDIPSDFNPSSHRHAWSEITDIPSAFKPSSHSHTPSEIGAPRIVAMASVASDGSNSGNTGIYRMSTGVYRTYSYTSGYLFLVKPNSLRRVFVSKISNYVEIRTENISGDLADTSFDCMILGV